MKFLSQIQKNLEANGFPQKKVSFDLEKLYEIADKKNENLNDILENLEKENIYHSKESDKIIFYRDSKQDSIQDLGPEDMYAKAQEAMKNMSPEEMEKIQEMAKNMSDEEKEQMMEQAKKMGLL